MIAIQRSGCTRYPLKSTLKPVVQSAIKTSGYCLLVVLGYETKGMGPEGFEPPID